MQTHLTYLERHWEVGQRHLVAGRYVEARRNLEAAESVGWRERDAASLRRVYLPLLETRRQIRLIAAEGELVICSPMISSAEEARILKNFLKDSPRAGGTILLSCSASPCTACRFAGSVQYESRRSGRCLEALLLIARGDEERLTTQADPTFAGGLKANWTQDAKETIGASTEPDLVVPLPRPGRYLAADALHAVARESLLIAWEALALKWQHRHPLPRDAGPWEEMARLRLALRIDPACEPVTMRLMALLELAEKASAQ